MRLRTPALVTLLLACSGEPTVPPDETASRCSESELIETADDKAEHAHVAVDSEGNAIALWAQYGERTRVIWANRRSVGGDWGTAERIGAVDANDSVSPRLAFDANGNALALWSQVENSRFDSVWTNQYLVGEGWQTAERVDDASAAIRVGDFGVDASGNAFVVWDQSTDRNAPAGDVWANHYELGMGWGTAERIGVGGRSSRIAVSPFGDAIAVWHSSLGISAAHYTADSGWGEAEQIADAENPTIAMDAAGNATVAWSAQGAWTRRFAVDDGWRPPELVWFDEAATASRWIPIASGDEGRTFLVWTRISVNGIGSIMASRRQVGSGWEEPERIETDAVSGVSTPLVATNAGNAVAVWVDFAPAPTHLWIAQYKVGLGWAEAERTENNSADIDSASAAVDAAGRAVVVWSQSDGTASSIWSMQCD